MRVYVDVFYHNMFLLLFFGGEFNQLNDGVVMVGEGDGGGCGWGVGAWWWTSVVVFLFWIAHFNIIEMVVVRATDLIYNLILLSWCFITHKSTKKEKLYHTGHIPPISINSNFKICS